MKIVCLNLATRNLSGGIPWDKLQVFGDPCNITGLVAIPHILTMPHLDLFSVETKSLRKALRVICDEHRLHS